MTQLFTNTFGSFTYIALVIIGMISIWQFKKHKFIATFLLITVFCVGVQLIHNEFNPTVTILSSEEVVVYDKQNDQDVWLDNIEVRKLTDDTKYEFQRLKTVKKLHTNDMSFELTTPVEITYNEPSAMSVYQIAMSNREVKINKVIVKKVTSKYENWRGESTDTKYVVEVNFDVNYSILTLSFRGRSFLGNMLTCSFVYE